MAKPKRCPGCGSERIVRIVYGLPSFEAHAEEERGEILLGGCMSGPGAPRWGCSACRWQPEYEPGIVDVAPEP